MNQIIFAIRNLSDKLVKGIRRRQTWRFYWQTYILSKLDKVEPDVYVVSYPKCGRTWLRVLLLKYLELQGYALEEFRNNSLVGISGGPTIKFEHDQGNWVPAPLRTNQLSFNALKYQDCKILFLVRDPRDVLVSSWYHLTYRERIYQKDLSAFIRDELVGIHKIVTFMNMWIENRHIPTDFLLLSYEQMHTNPVSGFQQALQFIGVDVTPKALQAAIEESTFDRMKQMEQRGSLKEPWMKPGAENSQKSMKVRQGKVGSYQDEMSKDDIAFLDNVIRGRLSAELDQYY